MWFSAVSMRQTVEWHGRHLGMDFILAIAEDDMPGPDGISIFGAIDQVLLRNS
jgi:hypothetical protein